MTSKSWAGFNLSPPMGLYRVKYMAELQGYECDIFDYDIDNEQEYLQKAKNNEYDIIGMSITHVNLIEDFEALYEFKKVAKNALIVAGGQEPGMNTYQILKTKIVDVIFLGLSELIFANFCSEYEKIDNKQNFRDYFLNFSGISFLDKNDKMIYNTANKVTKDMFRMFSYENVLKMTIPYEKYWDIVRKKRVDSFNNAEFIVETIRLYTTSHCPKKCGFCSSQNFLPTSQDANTGIIMLSGKEVFDVVLDSHKRYGAKAIMFSDDDFPVGNPAGYKRLEEFCNLVIKAKKDNILPKDMPFFCQARVDDFLKGKPGNREVRWDILHLMKKAGFYNIGMGIETFSDRLLKSTSVNKIGVSSKDCEMGINALLKVGIIPQLFIILGIPETKVEELIYTIKKAAFYMLKGADVSVIADMYSYPGSPVYLSRNYQTTFIDWQSPITKENLKIHHSITPFDKIIANATRNIDKYTDNELDKIKKRMNWEKDAIMSKTLVSMVKFYSVSKLVKKEDTAQLFLRIIYAMLHEEQAKQEILEILLKDG